MEETLGKRIVFHRKRLGLTQDALAELMGVIAQAVSKWENDQSSAHCRSWRRSSASPLTSCWGSNGKRFILPRSSRRTGKKTMYIRK